MLGVRLEVRLLALLAGWSPDIIIFFLGLASSSTCQRKEPASVLADGLKYYFRLLRLWRVCSYFRFFLPSSFSSMTACAAARREIGTRNGDALT